MSDDLISRKSAIKAVKTIIHAGLPEKAIYAALEELPVAYSVDAVCEEIHKIFLEKLDTIFEEYKKEEVPAGKIDWILKINKKIGEIVRNGGGK